MNDKTYSASLMAMFGVVVFFVLGIVIGVSETEITWQANAVEHGCAFYSPTSGEFTWKSSDHEEQTNE